MRNFISAIENQLREEKEELEAAAIVTKDVYPIIDKLQKKDIINAVCLKTKLIKLPPEYRDAVYGLCRIATESGPEGSVIVLDPNKVLAIINEIELDESYTINSKFSKNGKKFILGFSKKIAGAVHSLIKGKMAALCKLINDMIVKKIINTPATEKLSEVTAKKIKSIVKTR